VKAIRIEHTGGPEALRLVEHELAAPGPGEIRIRHGAIGVNFIDTYQRSGLYPLKLPTGLGLEAAGTVEAVGEGVTRFTVGDRAGYCTGPLGAYAEAGNVPQARAVRLPDAIDDATAAGAMLKGMTAHFLLRRVFRVEAGQTILFHAAAGGVGTIACAWARHLGATVIGTVGSPAKAELARAHGCAHTVDYTTEDFVARVREITGGAGVPVVYDSVGKATVPGSLDCLARRGMLVNFGNASGPAEPLNLLELSRKGSLFVTRPTLFDYVSTTEELDAAAAELFAVVSSGAVRVELNQRFALADAAEAHRALQARKTTGATILVP
jgi:NADPH2:quinone reductase